MAPPLGRSLSSSPHRSQLALASLAGALVGLLVGVLWSTGSRPIAALPTSPSLLQREAVLAGAEACPPPVACSDVDCSECPEPEPCPEEAPAPPEGPGGGPSPLMAAASFFKGGVAPDAGDLPPPPPWRLSTAAPDAPGGGSGPMGVFGRLIAWGFAPSLILDVGANAGAWAREAWSAFGSSSPPPTLLMFEGSERRAPTLSAVGFPYSIGVVGAQAQRINFFDAEGAGTGNSVLKEATRHFDGVTPQQMVARTLDQLLEVAYAQGIAAAPPKRGVLLKMDVQVREEGGGGAALGGGAAETVRRRPPTGARRTSMAPFPPNLFAHAPTGLRARCAGGRSRYPRVC